MKHQQISKNRKHATALGEMAVHFITAMRAAVVGDRGGEMDIAAFVSNYDAARAKQRWIAGLGDTGSEGLTRVQTAARYMMEELLIEASRGLDGVGFVRAFDLKLPDGVDLDRTEPSSGVDADVAHLSMLGDMAGWTACCGLEHLALGRQGVDPKRISRLGRNYLEAVRVDEPLNIRLNQAGVPPNGCVRVAAAGLRGQLSAMRCDLESRGLRKEGIFYWLVGRQNFAGTIIGGPPIPEIDMSLVDDHDLVGRPE